MSNNVINEVISELRPFCSQLEQGGDLTDEQLEQGKGINKNIKDLNDFIAKSGEVDSVMARGALNYGSLMLKSLNELPTEALNDESKQYIQESIKNTQQLLETINQSLSQSYDANNNQIGNMPMTEKSYSPYDAAFGATKFVLGTAAGITVGAGAFTAGALKSAWQNLNKMKNERGQRAESSVENHEVPVSSVENHEVLVSGGSDNKAKSNTQQPQRDLITTTPNDLGSALTFGKGPSEGSKEVVELNSGGTSIARPSESFESFADHQNEKAFADSVTNSFSALSMVGELSNHDELIETKLGDKIFNNLEESIKNMTAYSEKLSPESKEKFSSLTDDINKKLENAELDPNMNERIKEAMQKAIDQLKSVFRSISGKDKDKMNDFN
ncbi:MAG: hypothetical protein JJV99_07915 [Colwellia sp.]|nr:hypothetical protein [Colwellia sp.]|tara:strand:+ start:57327 stop:58481 length:1155 start_codon:yes stop_codon:yes gene_type:complete